MELQHYNFDLASLAINKGDIERLMGYKPGEAPDPFPALIEEVFDELPDHCNLQGGFIILDGPEFDLQSNTTTIRGHSFKTHKIVTRMLIKSERLALFACTAGEGIETWTKDANASGDPVKGFVIDAFGSEIAEAVANKLQDILKEQVMTQQKTITNRYSPGYCEWPVKDQQKLFSFFPEKFCGISLSLSSLMHPIKSISGITGIGTEVRYRPYICDSCKDERCIYRRLQQTS